jgi:hypothetical protein
MTLAELKTLIQNYVENEETTFVNSLDDFIKNAEERIFELIQFDYFRKNVTGSLTTGNTYLTTPTDYQMSFSLAVIDASGDYHYLDKKHPSFMREFIVDPTDSTLRALPRYYADFDKELSTASNNGSTIIVSPVPDANYSVELHYLYRPNSLLYGSLVEANIFLKGESDMQQQYEQRFMTEISRLKNLAEARGRKDEYRYDSLRSTVS